MRGRNILRLLFFIIFFGIGAGAVGVTVLSGDLLAYYRNKEMLASAQKTLERLESLNADYDVLLNRLESDPNLIKRLGPPVLGRRQTDQNTIYPKASFEHLNAVRLALMQQSEQEFSQPAVPDWLARASRPWNRTMLFISGACLVLISFVCFGPARPAAPPQIPPSPDEPQ